jgi:hypothetical protein
MTLVMTYEMEIQRCTRIFSHDKNGEKWAECVRWYRWAQEDFGVAED